LETLTGPVVAKFGYGTFHSLRLIHLFALHSQHPQPKRIKLEVAILPASNMREDKSGAVVAMFREYVSGVFATDSILAFIPYIT
jgi:hypothetical protein